MFNDVEGCYKGKVYFKVWDIRKVFNDMLVIWFVLKKNLILSRFVLGII